MSMTISCTWAGLGKVQIRQH